MFAVETVSLENQCSSCKVLLHDFESDRWFSLFVSQHQYPVHLHACGGGTALPLLLATHFHPRASRVHVGYRLLSHTLPGGAAVQLTA